MLLSFTVDGTPRQTAAGLLAATDELHKMAHPESIGRRYRRHLRLGSPLVEDVDSSRRIEFVSWRTVCTTHECAPSARGSGPNTKVSWTMVGSLTHPVGVQVSRGMDHEFRPSWIRYFAQERWLPTRRIEEC